MTDDLAIPEFLRRAPGPPMTPRERRKRMRPTRPEGERWVDATRWEIYAGATLSYTRPNGRSAGLAAGWRRVWVSEGRKWAWLTDGADTIKLPIAEWRQLQRHARQVPT